MTLAPRSFQYTLDAGPAKRLAWEAWRKGREQMSEATAHLRLQPSRRIEQVQAPVEPLGQLALLESHI